MKRIILYNTLTIIALLVGCRKIDLAPVDGNPIFTATAKLDGDTHEWQAGVNDYYMFSSFKKDSLGVYEFSGSFTKTDSIGGEVLTVRIRDFQQLPTGQPDITNALNRDLLFASQTGIDIVETTILDTIGWATNFNTAGSIVPNGPVNYQWDFGDGTSDTVGISSISHLYGSLPTQSVTLTIRDLNNSCAASLTKQLNLNANSQPCGLAFNLQLVNPANPDSGLLIVAQPAGVQPFIYVWSTNEVNPFIIIDSIGQIGASVTITDGSGCTVSGSVQTTVGQGTTLLPICVANFSNSPVVVITQDTVVIDTILVGDSLQFSKAKIEYTDSNGKFYSSFLGPQSATSYIKVLEVKNYEKNENGEKTKQVSLEFTCRLWDELGNFIEVSAGMAVIAVAYP